MPINATGTQSKPKITEEEKKEREQEIKQRRLKEESERKAQEEHLNRIRALIKEDRRDTSSRVQSFNDLSIAESASLASASVVPLDGTIGQPEVKEGHIRVKFICDTNQSVAEKEIITLSKTTTLADLKEMLKKRFKLKSFRIYLTGRKEITLKNNLNNTVDTEGIKDMCTVHIQKD
ncbi:hypothetical protein NEOKW01_1803 [Nematocida sp. AWRm80]|nr:hypothetical protein NEOKW01_1803 [Nematocida sp. AWRm80]